MIDFIIMALVPYAAFKVGGGWGFILGLSWSLARLIDQISE